jgi:hypothetical protein
VLEALYLLFNEGYKGLQRRQISPRRHLLAKPFDWPGPSGRTSHRHVPEKPRTASAHAFERGSVSRVEWTGHGNLVPVERSRIALGGIGR